MNLEIRYIAARNLFANELLLHYVNIKDENDSILTAEAKIEKEYKRLKEEASEGE